MAETHPIRLSPAEILHQAQRFFGPEGLGMELKTSQPGRAYYSGRDGFVELEIRPDGNYQIRLTIEHQGYEREIQAFRQQLGKQARAETEASN